MVQVIRCAHCGDNHPVSKCELKRQADRELSNEKLRRDKLLGEIIKKPAK